MMNIRAVAFKQGDGTRGELPELSPELYGSIGGRYSRSADGLEKLLAMTKGKGEGKAIDDIMRYMDYGHKSLGDMVPVPIFFDGISMAAVMRLWEFCNLAAGQERSTRYQRYDREGCLSWELSRTGVEELPGQVEETIWGAHLNTCFMHYNQAYELWDTFASYLTDEELGIPVGTREVKAQRLRRNFAFDRARYFLPMASLTGFTMIQSITEWNRLTTALYNGLIPWAEGKVLLDLLMSVLRDVAPHTFREPQYMPGFTYAAMEGHLGDPAFGVKFETEAGREGTAAICPSSQVMTAFGLRVGGFPVPNELRKTDKSYPRANRYDAYPMSMRHTPTNLRIRGISLAENRDLLRHRPGSRFTHPVIHGFYGGEDGFSTCQFIGNSKAEVYLRDEVLPLLNLLCESMTRILERQWIKAYDWVGQALGTQTTLEITNTLDKMGYMIELRTGNGAHYRYLRHMKDAHESLLRNSLMGETIKCGQGAMEDV